MKQAFKQNDFVLLWAILAICALFCRPLMPIDETRYISVAWEMWTHKHFLTPILNGTLYAHKPPMLFWLIHIGWALFGPASWTARIIPMIIALANLFLVKHIATLLWKKDSSSPHTTIYILLSMPLWPIWGTLVMFDMLLIFFILIATISILRIARYKKKILWNYIFMALATSAGILTKGPVFLVHISAIIIAYGFSFKQSNKEETTSRLIEIIGSVIAGTIPAILWAIIAITHTNNNYATEILWHQTIGRAIHSFAHARPFWWYLILLPILFFPWIYSKKLWLYLLKFHPDKGELFLKIWLITTIIIFSLISGKQGYYLLPAFVPFALLSGRQCSQEPHTFSGTPRFISIITLISSIILICITFLSHIYPHHIPLALQRIMQRISIIDWLLFTSLGLIGLYVSKRTEIDSIRLSAYLITSGIIFLHLGILRHLLPLYDVSATAKRLAKYQSSDKEIAVWPGRYAGQFSFPGRLKKPLVTLDDKEAVLTWARTHKDAIITTICRATDRPFKATPPLFSQPFRGKTIYIWNTNAINDTIKDNSN